ncbi:MAG: hypothetical protein P4L36_14835 [Holophaga sp.]|nr:hypothetical protein [Holophaga sp.]
MRLVTLILTGALALNAQTLPWRNMAAMPWQMEATGPLPAPCTAMPTQSFFSLWVQVVQDGKVVITDDKGLVRMKLGLPGRPVRAWRDWGTPVLDLAKPMPFSIRSPLQRGIGGMPVGAPDFRPALEGLLWIVDDDENVLTVIHPATSQVVYLPLPGGQDLTLVFHPDRLEVRETAVLEDDVQARVSWSLHWLGLLPQFIQLGKDSSADKPKGTAMLPFPKD